MSDRLKRSLIRLGKVLLATAGPVVVTWVIAWVQDPGFQAALPPWALPYIIIVPGVLLGLEKFLGWTTAP